MFDYYYDDFGHKCYIPLCDSCEDSSSIFYRHGGSILCPSCFLEEFEEYRVTHEEVLRESEEESDRYFTAMKGVRE